MTTTSHNVSDLSSEVARQLHEGHMEQLGIANTMSLADAYNRRKFEQQNSWRRELYRDQLPAMLRANGPQLCSPIELVDGWAIDRSMALPHLDRILADSDEIRGQRAGKQTTEKGTYRSFFQDMWTPEDCQRYPSFLDFATSTDLLATVANYLQCIPALSTTLPSGIRIVESNAAFDIDPEHPKDSQLYHIDYYSLPNVYVLVLLEDTTHEHGPWTFIPRTRSQEAKQALGYWQQGKGYRLSDEEVFSVVDPSEVIEFTYPRGTVLFIESSGCLHFGSRNSLKPRFQAMFGYTGAVRTDFTELFVPPKTYPLRESDSLLRKMVLTKNLLPSQASAEAPGSESTCADAPTVS